jgi:acetylornithine/N-succinyldiaminopimelate aminotransferase
MIPAVLPTYNRTPLRFERGEGSWLWTADGEAYLDFGSGIAVNLLGHAHPALVRTLTEQAGRLWHVSNLYEIPRQEELARRLTGATFADTVFFTNSGTEAMECAVKMARKYFHAAGAPERHRIITFEGAFHGRSSAGIAASGGAKMVTGFAPLLPGFDQVPFFDLETAEKVITRETAAILVEPIQGEGGVRPVPEGGLRALRALCDRHGLLLILDEIQCGMGRSGKLFVHETEGITPDIMLVAKGIGGGFPLGACLASERAASGMTAGTHGSTYGGNPLGCAVGSAVMDAVTAPGFLNRVAEAGVRLRQGLEALAERHQGVLNGVRGAGLMQGLRVAGEPAAFVKAGIAAKILTIPAADQTVRVLPPLTISDDDIDEGLARLDRAARAAREA